VIKIIKEFAWPLVIVILAIYGYQKINKISEVHYKTEKDSILAELKVNDSMINHLDPNHVYNTQKIEYFMNKRILDRMKLDSINKHK
jgi:hypothetical protein